MTRFAIIGFGEVGGIFARDLLADGAESVHVFDVSPDALTRANAVAGVIPHSIAAAAAGAADIVFVCVTAAAVPAAAASLAGGLDHAPLVVDVNSVSPATKQIAARTVQVAGGRYVEAAVMSSVPSRGLRTPMLLGGPHAATLAEVMAPFRLDARVFSEEVGRASAVKMCRSVMIKGLEALVTESLLAARYYGVESEVLRSLNDTLPHPDWLAQSRYLIGRSVRHGRRRAEEMREVAVTVREAGIDPLMSVAIAERQEWAAGRAAVLGPISTRD